MRPSASSWSSSSSGRLPAAAVLFVAGLAVAVDPARAVRAEYSAVTGARRASFDHARHAAHVPDCSTCHRYAADASPGAEVPAPDFERPAESDCSGCHPFERPPPAERVGRADPEVCGVCHGLDDSGRVALPSREPQLPALDFDHRDHDEIRLEDTIEPPSERDDEEKIQRDEENEADQGHRGIIPETVLRPEHEGRIGHHGIEHHDEKEEPDEIPEGFVPREKL